MTKSYEELLADMTGIIAKIYEKGYDKGYEQGKFSAQLNRIDGMTAEELTKEVQQEKRDRIVERAKKDISALEENGYASGLNVEDGNLTYHHIKYYVKFIVNKEKRTIVALVYRKSGRLAERGIAKAHPNDCFNVHIGKAIALRRALGLEIPSEYLNAPQPTEVRVGDVVYLKTSDLRIPYTRIISKVSNDYITYTNGGEDSIKHVYKNGKIIDDSREEATK